MANARAGNTWLVDTGSNALTTNKNQKISGIVLSTSNTNAVLTLKETSSGQDKITLKNATSGVTDFYDFSSCPLVFANGIYAATVTNCVATLIMTSTGGE